MNLLSQKYKFSRDNRPITCHVVYPREHLFQRVRSLVAELLVRAERRSCSDHYSKFLEKFSLRFRLISSAQNPRKGLCLWKMKAMEEVVEENEIKRLRKEEEELEDEEDGDATEDSEEEEKEEDAEDDDDDDDDDGDDDDDDDQEGEDDDDDVQEVVQSSGGPPVHSVDDDEDDDDDDEDDDEDGEGGGGDDDDDDDDDNEEDEEDDEAGEEEVIVSEFSLFFSFFTNFSDFFARLSIKFFDLLEILDFLLRNIFRSGIISFICSIFFKIYMPGFDVNSNNSDLLNFPHIYQIP